MSAPCTSTTSPRPPQEPQRCQTLRICARELAPDVWADCERYVTLIGSRKDCHLHIEHLDISKTHCGIVQTGGGVALVDLGSRSGTFVNEQRIRTHQLAPGDRVRLGPVELDLQWPASTASSVESTAPTVEMSLELAGERFVLCELPAVIGRRSSCQIVIDTPDASIAHALVFTHNGHPAICDLGSRSGTFVNGERVTVAWLGDGDLLTIGGERLLFSGPPMSAPDAVADPNADTVAALALTEKLPDTEATADLDKIVQAIQAGIAALGTQVTSRVSQLTEREASLQARHAELERREQQLKTRGTAYERWDAELKQRSAELDQRAASAEQQHARVERRKHSIEKARGKLRAAVARLKAQRAQIAADRRAALAENAALAAERKALERIRAEHAETAEQIAHQQAQLDAQRVEVDQRAHALDQREQAINAREARERELAAKMQQFQQALQQASQVLGPEVSAAANQPPGELALKPAPAKAAPPPLVARATAPPPASPKPKQALPPTTAATGAKNKPTPPAEADPKLPAPVVDQPLFAPIAGNGASSTESPKKPKRRRWWS